MEVSVIRRRLEARIKELGLRYNQIDAAIGCREGWLSGVLKGKQATIKTKHLKGLCKTLAVSEAWLRNEDITSPSLFVVAPPPSRRAPEPQGAGRAEFLTYQRRQIDAEIAAIKTRLRQLQDQRAELIEAEKAARHKT